MLLEYLDFEQFFLLFSDLPISESRIEGRNCYNSSIFPLTVTFIIRYKLPFIGVITSLEQFHFYTLNCINIMSFNLWKMKCQRLIDLFQVYIRKTVRVWYKKQVISSKSSLLLECVKHMWICPLYECIYGIDVHSYVVIIIPNRIIKALLLWHPVVISNISEDYPFWGFTKIKHNYVNEKKWCEQHLENLSLRN